MAATADASAAGNGRDAEGDRVTDSGLRRRILDEHQGKTIERPAQSRIGRDHRHDRPQAGRKQDLGTMPDERLAGPRFQQLLPSEPARPPGGEQDPRNQPAVAAALSCCSTQLPNRCVSRWATSCMMPLRPNWATTPLTCRSLLMTTLVPASLGVSSAVVVEEAPPRPRLSTPWALISRRCPSASMFCKVTRPR